MLFLFFFAMSGQLVIQSYTRNKTTIHQKFNFLFVISLLQKVLRDKRKYKKIVRISPVSYKSCFVVVYFIEINKTLIYQYRDLFFTSFFCDLKKNYFRYWTLLTKLKSQNPSKRNSFYLIFRFQLAMINLLFNSCYLSPLQMNTNYHQGTK